MKLSRKHKALILRSRTPEKILTVIPTAKKIMVKGIELVAVPHRVEEVRVLRNMGYKAPSPIRYYYDWPRNHTIPTPFHAQAVTAEFLTYYNRGYVLNGLGSGKTLAALWAYDFLRKQGVHKSVLVISPLSTLERTWADSVFEHFPDLRCVTVYGSKERRLKLLAQPADVYVVNHHGAAVIADELAKRQDITLVIVDELSQAARNARTSMWKTFNKIVNDKKAPRACWGMTATPTPNDPTDAWAQARLVTPETAPPYFKRFKDTVMRQVGPFTWLARDDANTYVQQLLQPAVRFSREECVDLPPTTYASRTVELTPEQAKAYKQMHRELCAQIESGEILAVNEAVKVSKLVQIACLARGTLVLTDKGYVPIQSVGAGVRVWDGLEWVSQEGAAYKGLKPVVNVRGVLMTGDHKVLVDDEWVTAAEVLYGDAGERFDRTTVRLPDGYEESEADVRDSRMRDLGVPMRLRDGNSQSEPVSACSTSQAPSKLRVSPRQRDAQAIEHRVVQRMVRDAATMLEHLVERLAALWREGHTSLRSMGRVVPGLLQRHGGGVQARALAGACGQRRALLTEQLPLGNSDAASVQPAQFAAHLDAERRHDRSRSGQTVWTENSNAARTDIQVRVAGTESTYDTYDLINCGPRNRFVVKAPGGRPFIVHNCGVVYGADKSEITIPCQPRLAVVEELVEESESKTIVFVPYVSSVSVVADHLMKKGYSVGVIHGGVSKGERDQIFNAFQRSAHPRVIVAQPAAMSHGLTLTASSTIVWYAPTTSPDTYEQANGRITRPGQKFNTLIVNVEGTPVERRMYDRLKAKQKMQNLLLDSIQKAREPA